MVMAYCENKTTFYLENVKTKERKLKININFTSTITGLGIMQNLPHGKMRLG